jgi:hypothetical protein
MSTIIFISACIIAEAIRPGIVLNKIVTLPKWQVMVFTVLWCLWQYAEGPLDKLRHSVDTNLYNLRGSVNDLQRQLVSLQDSIKEVARNIK